MSDRDYLDLSTGASHPGKRKRNYATKFVVGLFFVVVAIVVYTSFYGTPANFSITGNVISNPDNSTESIPIEDDSGIQIHADLTVPNYNFEGSFGDLSITSMPSSTIFLAKEKILTPDYKKSLVSFSNYQGGILFSQKNINFNGKTSEIFIEGIPISSKTSAVKVSSGENFTYEYVNVDDRFNFKRLEYVTSGSIKINDQTTIPIKDGKLSLEGFRGSLRVFGGRFILDGRVDKLNLEGENTISIK